MSAAPTVAAVLAELRISRRDVARELHIGNSTVALLVRGIWPVRDAPGLRQRLLALLASRGAGPAQLRALRRASAAKKVAPGVAAPGAVSTPPNPEEEAKENDAMLLRKETLTPQAQRHFGLPRTLFGLDDIQVREDVLLTAQMRYVRSALMDAAQNNGFIAIAGESGAGKSTLREEMEERIREERLPIILIKPWPHGMEPTEQRGTPLRAGHIAEAIVHALAPGQGMKASPQARLTQIFELLKGSRAAGYKHLLLIEEAHRIPVPTLKHLKNFLEMKDGLRRLLGIALIGQTELQTLLSDRNHEVREIVQRCEQIELQPLDNDLPTYLAHKLQRAGLQPDKLLDADAVDAIRARLIVVPRGGRAADGKSICYPQVVNNLMCRALNAAAAVGFAKVDAQVIAGC